MAQRSKRLAKRASDPFRKNAAKPEISGSLKTETEPVTGKEDRKDAVMRELLYTLLPLCTTECEIRKNFAKVKFRNENSYSGWLSPHGFQGFGKYEFACGASYRGSFDKSLTKHFGGFVSEHGDTYEGEFLGGQRHGQGLYKAEGFQYKGNFRSGAFHGDGVWKSGVGERKGHFDDGLLMEGEVHECSGVYRGSFDESGRRKCGQYTFKNGNTYTGHWRDDLYFGYGVYSWTDRDGTPPCTQAETKYTGYWMKGERHAMGMLTFRGRVVISQWREGKKRGAGVVFATNGNCYAGLDLFDGNSYRQGFKIRHSPESKAILNYIVKLLAPSVTYDMENKSHALVELVRTLVTACGAVPSPVNPIRIPDYELGNVAPDFCATELEAVCLQQVLSENYNDFRQLYRDYKHPGDEYVHPLGLNLLYMDVLQRVRDVNIVECMSSSRHIISNLILSIDGVTALTPTSPVPFYNFFQHIVCITKVLMQSEQLKLAVEQLKPTYFGTLAMQVIVVLRMLRCRRRPKSLVREALLVSRPAVTSLLQSIEGLSPGDSSIRAAYRLLKSTGAVLNGRSWNFIKAVETCQDKVFKEGRLWDIDFQMSPLELVEIVLCTCQLNLREQRSDLSKSRMRRSGRAIGDNYE